MGYKLYLAIAVAGIAYLVRTTYFPPIVNSPIVEISTGKLQGKISLSRDGRNYFEYLAVPYAQPPVGKLRYESPERFTKKWDGIRDATKAGSSCIQMDLIMGRIEGSEDCLFVNVHTPKIGKDAKLPVLVWIHGGIFAFGSGNSYHGDYFMDEDVVLVTVNYRLASFGFLNSGDGVVRGNMGLKDQSMALQWVQDNIERFGGNKNDVTLIGESAGGASVHFQILSPMSKGLFHKAIAQSGLATMPWAVYPHPAKQAKRFAQQLNCPVGNTQEMVKCLKSKEAMDIVQVHREMKDNLRPVIATFVPTVEMDKSDGKAFLLDMPRRIIESGNYNKVPFFTGVNNAEGLMMSAPAVANSTITHGLLNAWDKTVENIMLMPEDTPPVVYEKVKAFYMHGNGLDLNNPMAHYENLTNLFSDWLWNLGFHNALTSHAQVEGPPLFIYYYAYQGDFGLDQLLLALKGGYHPLVEIMWSKVSKWFKTTVLGQTIERHGSCHGDELAMEFFMPMMASVPKGSVDYEFSKKFVKLIVQFAKLDLKLKKSPVLEFLGKVWTPQEKNSELKYMKLNWRPEMISEPFKDRIDFWQSL